MAILRVILALLLFLASSYCLLGVLLVVDIMAPVDHYAPVWACGWLVLSILMFVGAIRQLLPLVRQPPTSKEEKSL
jgi:hypothetical protein